MKIVFSFRILLKRFDPVSSTAFSSVGFRCDSCPLNQPIFNLKFPQALKKTSLCVFDLYESLKCMLVEFAYAVLIDHVLHRCQLSALVPAHFFICIGSGSIFSLAFFFFFYYLFKVFCQSCTTYCMYVYIHIYIYTHRPLFRYTCSIAW